MVQDGYLQLKDTVDKRIKISTFSKRAAELNEMRFALIERLQKMDRTSVDFFPVDCHVEYIHPMYSQKQKFGRVVGHVDGMCQCQFENEEYQVKVDPIHLKLRFIRGGYPF